MERLKHRFERGQVEFGGPLEGDAKGWSGHAACEGQTLDMEKPRRPLQIGQGFGIDPEQALEACLGGDLKPDQIEKGDVVLLQNTKEIIDVAAGIVDHLAFRAAGALEKDAAHADERCGRTARHRWCDRPHQ